jgi:hypothetical protein
MTTPDRSAPPVTRTLPNGSGAAAVLSAAAGCFTVSALSILGDKLPAVKSSSVFYKPTGPLSGVTTGAVLVWLFTWAILEWRWRKKTVAARRIAVVAILLLALSLILAFPPVGDRF